MVQQEFDREALIRQYGEHQAENDARIRELVIKYGRRDVLAKEVLGFDVKPFHFAMMQHAAKHKDSLHLVFRGSGKSTTITVVGIIFELLREPDIRICIASETQTWAVRTLREIKGHLEGNETLRRIFGDLVGPVWNETEIVVSTRSRPRKEPSVLAVGIGGQIAGLHFDSVYGDDLVLEENSRTPLGREKLKIWWYKSFAPTFEPHCRVKIIGTRYHFDDLYGHFLKHEFKKTTQVIPALKRVGDGWATPWPEKFSVQHFLDLWDAAGTVIFSTQYLCDSEAMKGDIFQYDWMDFVGPEEVPENVVGIGGVDLAIKAKEQNDSYARVGIGVTPDGHVYVLTSFIKKLLFVRQTDDIVEAWRSGLDGWFEHGNEPDSRLLEIGIEDVGYQDAQIQNVALVEPTIRIIPIRTIKDKVTRAHKLQPLFENGKVHFVGKHPRLVDQLILFTGAGDDDLFDALDIAITTAFRPRRATNRRRNRVGLI